MKRIKQLSILILLLSIAPVNEAMAQRIKHNTPRSGNTVKRKAPANNRSVNGGAVKRNDRARTQQVREPRRTTTRPSPKRNNNVNRRTTTRRNTNVNVNVNVRVNKNVRVNHHGGRRYYNGHRGYYPYRYHRYQPYRWGPSWHPVGFFVRTLAATAIIISINNQRYHYHQGVYYVQGSGGYTVVDPPTNIVVNTLPEGFEKITLNGDEYYYFGGAFYVKEGSDYRVVDAPDGAVVTYIPEGAEEEMVDDEYFVIYNYTYYRPISQGGKNMYQVVVMETI